MIVYGSAIIAILNDEPDAQHFSDMISASQVCSMSAGTFLETAIVFDKKAREEGKMTLDFFIHTTGIEIVTVTLSQVRIARLAYQKYGRANHPARLNFGDCFAYALAQETGSPLLFKGEDFSKTDVRAAV
ncbi:MAG: type II toxin-antitoxin system VapC family toxin [Chitinophagales bacterium]|nr:type II toxin-antitoxin system VapC family toxin [Hyphomicrobiales bacterium]